MLGLYWEMVTFTISSHSNFLGLISTIYLTNSDLTIHVIVRVVFGCVFLCVVADGSSSWEALLLGETASGWSSISAFLFEKLGSASILQLRTWSLSLFTSESCTGLSQNSSAPSARHLGTNFTRAFHLLLYIPINTFRTLPIPPKNMHKII